MLSLQNASHNFSISFQRRVAKELLNTPEVTCKLTSASSKGVVTADLGKIRREHPHADHTSLVTKGDLQIAASKPTHLAIIAHRFSHQLRNKYFS